MISSKPCKIPFILSLILFRNTFLVAQDIPIDPNLRHGQLSNGFTYYVKNNDHPSGEVNVYLIVKAGVNQEDDDQLELAHFLEHMPFRETKHFTDAWSFFESKGLMRGNDVNAKTGSDRTYYYIENIPSDNKQLIQDGLQFLRDCAGNIKLKPEDIDSERGVLLGEILKSNTEELFLRPEYKGTKMIGHPDYIYRGYKDRIGNIKTFKHQSLIDFYNSWYRPDLQSVIVVGDIDAATMVKDIELLFGDLPISQNAKHPKEYKYPEGFKWGNNFTIATYPKRENLQVLIYMKRFFSSVKNQRDLREKVLIELYNKLVANRISTVENKSYKNLWQLYMDPFNTYGPDFSALVTDILVNPDSIKSGVIDGLTEIERIKQNGFHELELEKAKKQVLASMTNGISSSKEIAKWYMDNFIRGSVKPDPGFFKKLIVEAIDEIDLGDINQKAIEWISESSRDIVILAPDHLKDTLPSETTILDWLDQVKTSNVPPYTPVEAPIVKSQLLSNDVIAKLERKKSSKDHIEEIGVTKLRLTNGNTVYLKPIDSLYSKSSDIEFLEFRSIVNLLDSDSTVLTKFRRAITALDGVGQFSSQELKTFYEYNGIKKCYPFIFKKSAGIRGSSGPNNIETLLQVIYLHYSEPKFSESEMQDRLSRISSIRSTNTPSRLFFDTINSTLDKYLISDGPILISNFTNIDFNSAKEAYQSIFQQAENFKFIISGNFKLDEIIPLVEKYIGNLSTKNPTILKEEPPIKTQPNIELDEKDKQRKLIYAGNDDRAEVKLYFIGTFEYNQASIVELRALEKILQGSLLNSLRVEEGITYSVHVGTKIYPEGYYYLMVSYDSDPSNLDISINSIKNEISSLKTGSVDSLAFQKVITLESKSYQNDLLSPDYWVRYLSDQIQYNRNISEVSQRQSIINNLSENKIVQAANKYLRDDNMLQFILLPENLEPKNEFGNSESSIEEGVIDKSSELPFDKSKPNWNDLYDSLKSKHSNRFADSVVHLIKMSYYRNHGISSKYTSTLISFYDKFQDQRSAEELNNYAWDIFQESNLDSELRTALEWSKSSLIGKHYENNPRHLDTYASILYKLGNKDEALQSERRAFLYALDRFKVDVLIALFKMEKGEFPVSESHPILDYGAVHDDDFYWKKISSDLKDKAGEYDMGLLVSFAKTLYYKETHNWPLYTKNLVKYFNKYEPKNIPEKMNDYAWEVFLYSSKKGELKKALAWSKSTLVSTDHQYYHQFVDTYSNLLYKLGSVQEAIKWQERAIGICPRRDIETFKSTLKKMLNGEHTWISF